MNKGWFCDFREAYRGLLSPNEVTKILVSRRAIELYQENKRLQHGTNLTVNCNVNREDDETLTH